MVKKLMKLATYMLAIAGLTFVFTSCNEENEEVMNRKANYKSSISSGSNPYAWCENNNYSPQEIFQKTIEFSRYLHTNEVPNMDIRQAVVVLETFWNYGLVANQPEQTNSMTPEKEFELSVSLNSDGTVNGSNLRTAFIQMMQQAVQEAGGQNLNIADVYVKYIDSENIVFGFYLPPFIDDPDIHKFEGPHRIKVIRKQAIGPYVNIPTSGMTINPNILDTAYVADTTVPELNSVVETRYEHCIHLKTKVTGYLVNIKKDSLSSIALQVQKASDSALIVSPYTYNQNTHRGIYNVLDSQWMIDTYFPSLIYTLNHGLSLPLDYYVLSFADYAYRIPVKTIDGIINPDLEETRFVIRKIVIGRYSYEMEIAELDFNDLTIEGLF